MTEQEVDEIIANDVLSCMRGRPEIRDGEIGFAMSPEQLAEHEDCVRSAADRLFAKIGDVLTEITPERRARITALVESKAMALYEGMPAKSPHIGG